MSKKTGNVLWALLILFIVCSVGYGLWSGKMFTTSVQYDKVHVLDLKDGYYVLSIDYDCTPEHLAATYKLFLSEHKDK